MRLEFVHCSGRRRVEQWVKLKNLVLSKTYKASYYFFYLDEFRLAEGGDDLAAGDEGEPLDAVEVGVLDGHDALVGEQLLGVVVDELPVDEDVDVVLADQLHLKGKNVFLNQRSTRIF